MLSSVLRTTATKSFGSGLARTATVRRARGTTAAFTDTIFYYSKGPEPTWNAQYVPYDEKYIEQDYRRVDENGRRYRIDNLQGPGGAAKGNPYYEVMGVWRYWRYSREKMERADSPGPGHTDTSRRRPAVQALP